jgi:putative ABC transport system ATP-binding protein
MLQLQSVSKSYPGRNCHPVTALDEVNLTVTDGEFVTIVGPSGSGKSTLLFTIGAMLRPTMGKVVLDRTDIYGLSAGKRTRLRRDRLGFVFQTFNLIPYLSCLENIVLPAALGGKSRRLSLARGRKMLDRLGLGHRLAHRPKELSVGERQRAAMCRSLINGPDLLLADEPTGNLDPEMTEEVCQLLQELNAEGQTIILATHDRRVAGAGSRTLGILNGKIVDDTRTGL